MAAADKPRMAHRQLLRLVLPPALSLLVLQALHYLAPRGHGGSRLRSGDWLQQRCLLASRQLLWLPGDIHDRSSK